MAGMAILQCGQMARALDLMYGRQERVDMAAFAALGQVIVHRATERGRTKGIGGTMTGTAFAQRRNMVKRFSGSNAATVAFGTIIGVNANVIIQNSGKAVEIGSAVTAGAVLAGRHMITRLAQTDTAIMAQGAIGGIYARVVKRRRDECRGVVTGAAILDGRQVIEPLAKADDVIVAGGTRHRVQVTGGMVEATAAEGAGSVAFTTIFAGRQMDRRNADSAVDAAIMAGHAGIADHVRAGMVNECRGEQVGGMTGPAIRSGSHMVHRGFCWCIDAGGRIMTGVTGLRGCIHQTVIENAAHAESDDAVAVTAIQ